jgi:hypothetical protein
MRNLSDIIEDCKLNKKLDYDELKYALLVMTGVLNLVNLELVELYAKGKMPGELERKVKLENGICTMYHKALNRPPKEYLGWDNDPENPEYQKFHAIGNKLIDKALNGELPNQKKELVVWTYFKRPMTMGGSVLRPVGYKTLVSHKLDLGKGFYGYEIKSPMGVTVIIEEKSGAIVGNNLDTVKKDIALSNIDTMQNQVNNAREKLKAVEIIDETKFWSIYEKLF